MVDEAEPKTGANTILGCDINPGMEVGSDAILGCDIARQFQEENEGTDTGWPLDPNLASPDDIDNVMGLTEDYTYQHFPLIPWKRLLTTVDELDDVHGEISEIQKRWSPVIQVRAFVVAPQVTQPLTRFGVEDVRNAEVQIATPDLVSAGLATIDSTYDVTLIGDIGDHFYYHKREYEVKTIVPAARFGNTDIVLFWSMKAERYRGHSPDVWGPY